MVAESPSFFRTGIKINQVTAQNFSGFSLNASAHGGIGKLMFPSRLSPNFDTLKRQPWNTELKKIQWVK
jgi:phosphomevalonate kinase